MVFQNYQNLIEMTSNILIIIAFGVGIKCPRKIHLNTQWGGGKLVGIICTLLVDIGLNGLSKSRGALVPLVPTALRDDSFIELKFSRSEI